MINSVYISGGITGIAPEIVQANFNTAMQKLTYLNFKQIVNPLAIPHKHNGMWIDYMKEDIQAMLNCESVYMLKNWRASKDATIEHDLAKSLGMPVYYQ